MRHTRLKTLARVLGATAIVAAIALCLQHRETDKVIAGGPGDSATGTQYTSPVVPAMSLNPTNMSVGATAIATTSVTAIASMASPTLKAAKPFGF